MRTPSLPPPQGEEKYITAKTYAYPLLKQNARSNRSEPTEAESVLWNYLRCKQLGVKFRRQQIIEQCIVDFVCLGKQVIIEVDGKYHTTEEQKGLDDMRDEQLKSRGYKVLRFTNEEVTNNIEQVIECIKNNLYEQ